MRHDEPVVASLRERWRARGLVARLLSRLGYRAEPSDVEILISRYARESRRPAE